MKLYKLIQKESEELLDLDTYYSYLKKIILFIFIFIIIIFLLKFIRTYWHKSLTTKIHNKFIFYYILPVIGTLIFGIIDSLSFFIFEDTYLHFLNSFTHDVIISSLILGSISAFVALYFGRNMHHIIELIIAQKLEPSPLQEGIGILLGTAIVILGYVIFKKYSNKINGINGINEKVNKN